MVSGIGHLIGLIIGVIGIYWLIDYISESKNNQGEEESEMGTMEENCEAPKTRGLLVRTLAEIGCEVKETEDSRIRFDHQGVTFLMEAVDDCLFVNLIWPWCYSFSKFDIDEFARMRQVVNEINMKGSVSVFYSIADTDEVAVHMKKNFLFVPQVPQLKDYLKLMFDSFFRTARTLDVEIEKMRLKESTR